MKRRKELLDYATVFFALPFVLYLVVLPLIPVVEEVPPLDMILALAFGAPIVFTDLLFSNLWLYLIISFCALLLMVRMLIGLVASYKGGVWRHKRLYLLLLAIISVLAYPFLNPYQLPAKAIPGVEMDLVEPLNLLTSAVKRTKERAEVRDCVPEPLGWADSETIVYRRWCGGYYHPFKRVSGN